MISSSTDVIVVTSLICSGIDYFNTILARLPISTSDRLRNVRHLSRAKIRSHRIYTLRDDLHWLPVSNRITFRLCLLGSQQGAALDVFSVHLRTVSPSYYRDRGFTLPCTTITWFQELVSNSAKEHSPSHVQLHGTIYRHMRV